MTKRKLKDTVQNQQQPYDNLLKSLLEGREEQMLSYFLAGAEYLETLDIEIHRTTLRVDRVYSVMYRGQRHILHLEFESGSDNNMDARLLDYHAYLYRKYAYPIISIVIYPFRTTMVTSPLREMSGDQELLVFYFRVLPLWQLDAERYVREHAVFMYALLPTIDKANKQVLNTAIDEMVEYYKDNSERLARELRWMGIVLRRADTVALDDKREIEERLNMYDDLIEQDPKMRRMRAESEARGKAIGEARGKAIGEAKTLQKVVISLVENRFPPLATLAREKVMRVTKPDTLNYLFNGVIAAPDENTARQLFDVLVV